MLTDGLLGNTADPGPVVPRAEGAESRGLGTFLSEPVRGEKKDRNRKKVSQVKKEGRIEGERLNILSRFIAYYAYLTSNTIPSFSVVSYWSSISTLFEREREREKEK